MKLRKSNPLGVRLSPDIKAEFLKKCVKHGGQSEVLRVLITAYVEDRVTIKPKEELK